MKSRTNSVDESHSSSISSRSTSLPSITLGDHLKSLRDIRANSLGSRGQKPSSSTASAARGSATSTSSSSSTTSSSSLRLREEDKRPLSGRSTPSSTSSGGRLTPSLPSLPLFSAQRPDNSARGKEFSIKSLRQELFFVGGWGFTVHPGILHPVRAEL